MSMIGQVHAAIERVCPIVGVSIGKFDDKNTWRIDFTPEATPEQQAAAQTALDGFDPLQPEPKPKRETDRETAVAKIDDVLADATVPKKVRDALAAIKQVLG